MTTASELPWPAVLQYSTLVHPQTADNLAVDEELMRAVNGEPVRGWLRIWEQPTYAVVLGRSNRAEREANLPACAADGVEVLQRCSGGGAVVIGPGCLCYSLVLPLTDLHRQAGVTAVTANIMQKLAAGLGPPAISVQGVSDLTCEGRKFSGNSQRWLKHALLHHGTVLYDFDLSLVSRFLQFPSRVPDYRDEREHLQFVRNLDLPRQEIIQRLRRTWNAADEV